ncbi:2-polyprenyl-6-methoxyphenol hydroxylase-like FAD-dependent oxidoreductase [Humibacillus xanthopallidus]|uniref:2-polyprenyl-6-methoxyphenol hydroxylase-like FAD-dependent oxidoreductase n=1 Tax=Humibacillus xanthopallidus TaxID=412689 RepID=A0A543PUM3_9MICO|nr:FAD-dependent monooxygenase [Humibacillus xanthopallidus]TQN47782.1 2-polyprenyl-6-methoxyphenol hydroxylase-like FAD-dependent oxidoreductase [Humibacillus xanthopallidus]
MTTSPVRRVLIVGGGIAGGVAALALRQRGVDVVVVEQRAEMGGVGHGITLQGNALKAFHSVGVFERIAERGFPFAHLRMRSADGDHVIAEIPTPPMGGTEVPPTMGALRGDVADVLADEVVRAGVDVRLARTVTALDDRGDSVVVALSDGTTEEVDLVIGADGIRSQVRGMIGIEAEPQTVGMGIWRVVAERPEEMDCSELYYGGPKFKAGYTPISEDHCYAFLLEENLDRSFVGEKPNGKVLKEHGAGYGGTWGKVRDSIADDAVVNYQWIEAVQIDGPWHRGRVVLIGDAAHACPPLIAQGAAMSAEDGVVLADVIATSDSVEQALDTFMERRGPRVGLVLGNSLQLAEWEIHPETPGADPGRVMGQTLHALCAPA